MGEITTLLSRWKQGDGTALDSLASLTDDQLHTITAGYLRHESLLLDQALQEVEGLKVPAAHKGN